MVLESRVVSGLNSEDSNAVTKSKAGAGASGGLQRALNGVSVIPYINNSSSALLAKPLEGRLKAA